MRLVRSAALALLLATLMSQLVSCGRDPSPPSRRDVAPATLEITTDEGKVRLRVRIADSPVERARGLMWVRELEPDSGMAFLFERPHSGRFWMKNTLIPLSIAFWDEKGRIVRILDMEPCRRTPCPLYSPGVPYVGAVEANQGYFTEHGVRPGDTVRLYRA